MNTDGGQKNAIKPSKKMKSPYYLFALKILISNVIATLISTMYMFTFMPVMEQHTSTIVLTLLGGISLAVLIYSSAWRVGNADFNRVKYNHIKYSLVKGLICGLMSQIPGIVLAVLNFMLHYASGIPGWIRPVYNVFYLPLLGLSNLGDNVNPVYYFIPILIAPVFAQIGYVLGYKDISILYNIVYKKDSKKK